MEQDTRHVSNEARIRLSAILAELYFAHPKDASRISSDLRATHGFEISLEGVASDIATLSAAGLVRDSAEGATLTAKGLAVVFWRFEEVVDAL